MIRFITWKHQMLALLWSVFILFTLGTVDFDVEYDDGLHLRYRSWLDNLIEKVKGWQ